MKKVLVSGVFNVLHPGHIRLFRYAKECGDTLIVAVQSDDSCEHPIHVEKDFRLEMVLSNNYVDEAFLTNESIIEIVQRIRPNILVKGREFENEINPEECILKSYGGEIVFDSGDAIFSSLDLMQKVDKCSIELPIDYMDRHNITRPSLLSCIDKFSEIRVAVIGDLIMDEYITCDPIGMSQEDPTIVVTPIDNSIFIGGAGIVSAHASGLGAKVDFITVVGDDPMHKNASKELESARVNSFLMLDKHRPTTFKQRYRCKGKTLLRVSHLHQRDISKSLQYELIRKIEKLINKIDLLVFSDFNYGVLTSYVVNRITKLAKIKGVFIAADSQSSSQIGDISRYNNVGLLTPTEREARIAMQDSNNGLIILSENLRNKTNADNILLKLGEEGVIIHANGDDSNDFLTDKIEALNPNPVDVSGAGDSMLIMASMVLSMGGSIWEAALLGSLAAGVQVGRLGNQPLKIDEINGLIKQ
jgi:rfaE bifunctional protein kinase chain/domain